MKKKTCKECPGMLPERNGRRLRDDIGWCTHRGRTIATDAVICRAGILFLHIAEQRQTIDSLHAELAACKESEAVAQERIEQLEVQLAGCSVAAMGWDRGKCKPGDYGWSASFGDVKKLRIQAEELEGMLKNLHHNWIQKTKEEEEENGN